VRGLTYHYRSGRDLGYESFGYVVDEITHVIESTATLQPSFDRRVSRYEWSDELDVDCIVTSDEAARHSLDRVVGWRNHDHGALGLEAFERSFHVANDEAEMRELHHDLLAGRITAT
jgi:hypothetical protein